jgi:hypothetical protein
MAGFDPKETLNPGVGTSAATEAKFRLSLITVRRLAPCVGNRD